MVKRRRLFTAQELAKEIGVRRNTIGKLEKDPLSGKGATLRKHYLLLGWRLRFAQEPTDRRCGFSTHEPIPEHPSALHYLPPYLPRTMKKAPGITLGALLL